MPILLSMLLAVVPATPVEANTWFTSKAHPKTALEVTQRGQIGYAIDVSPDGKALRCTTKESGDLDRKICDIIMKSARFTPAMDAQGQPAFGLYEGVASFLMPGSKGRPDRSRMAVSVDSLPDGITGPAYARVAYMVDTAGAIRDCTAMAGERRRFMQTVEALGPQACAALAKDYRPTLARDAAGNAVASVQNAMVRFELRPAS